MECREGFQRHGGGQADGGVGKVRASAPRNERDDVRELSCTYLEPEVGSGATLASALGEKEIASSGLAPQSTAILLHRPTAAGFEAFTWLVRILGKGPQPGIVPA